MIFLNIDHYINIFYNFTPVKKVLKEITSMKMNTLSN